MSTPLDIPIRATPSELVVGDGTRRVKRKPQRSVDPGDLSRAGAPGRCIPLIISHRPAVKLAAAG
jgi:hypothetical protein